MFILYCNIFYFGLHVFCVIFTVFQFSATVRKSMESIKFASKHFWFWIQFFARRQIWQQMALAWKLCIVIDYSDKQWCTDSHWVLYFVFCCPLCNGWLEELIHLFASCVVWRQNLLLLHILNVLARLEPFANKMCHLDHECRCFWPVC